MTISMADQRRQNIIQAVREYGRRLFYFIRGRVNTDEDAEDILQDVWYQFSNVLETEPIEQTSAWLFRVARNRIIDKYRKHQTASLEEEMFGEDEEGKRQPRRGRQRADQAHHRMDPVAHTPGPAQGNADREADRGADGQGEGDRGAVPR